MKTRITELFGIEHPVLLPGMTRVSVPTLVAAISNSGGLGLLATVSLNASETRDAIREVRKLTSQPFGIGIPLMVPDAEEKVRIALSEQVPVINYALGKGDWIAKEAHTFGGKVIATITNERHALKAVDAGADALLVTGHEAAGHGSPVTSLVLIPALADRLSVPLIAAGGFGDGRGLAAALALGADAVAMGTRFSTAQESPLHGASKQAVLDKSIADTICTNRFDGMECRIMLTPKASKILQEKVNYFQAFLAASKMASTMSKPWWQIITGVLRKGPARTIELARMAGAAEAMRLAVDEGDHQNGLQPIGQVQGLINDSPTVEALMGRILQQAIEASSRASAGLS
ncbi:MAG: nitronate monooxygenase [Pseudomonadales bacterium]|nr:nitronate monooxygenase [Pseudomonadales bacterium]